MNKHSIKISNNIQLKDLTEALVKMIASGMSSYNIFGKPLINPSRKVILRDGKSVVMKEGEYQEYFDIWHPPEWDTMEEYRDKKMVLEL